MYNTKSMQGLVGMYALERRAAPFNEGLGGGFRAMTVQHMAVE
jgi:hypothetical protein